MTSFTHDKCNREKKYPPLKSYGLNLRSNGFVFVASDMPEKLNFTGPSELQISADGIDLMEQKVTRG